VLCHFAEPAPDVSTATNDWKLPDEPFKLVDPFPAKIALSRGKPFQFPPGFTKRQVLAAERQIRHLSTFG
jgi:hypothetical protein